eukprot:symbB.v1.2.016797.t1/scaffold1270.1/size227213/9
METKLEVLFEEVLNMLRGPLSVPPFTVQDQLESPPLTRTASVHDVFANSQYKHIKTIVRGGDTNFSGTESPEPEAIEEETSMEAKTTIGAGHQDAKRPGAHLSLNDIALAFPNQPRAAVGEVVTKAVERCAPTAQCTAVEVWLLAGGFLGMAEEVGADTKDEGPAKKKQKTTTDMTSARLRHIMLKFQEGAPKTPDGKKVRSKAEAETLMRKIMRALNEEAKELKSKHRGRKPEDYALKSERFTKLCKEHSECPSAQKGGAMCGDLGWVSKDMQSKRGGNFRELVAAMRPGDYSDIVTSTEGLHLLQRIA